MNERTARLRQRSLDTEPRISCERAALLTRFYRNNHGRYSVPVTRALAFKHLCENKTIYLGEDELIVGERGPEPKAVPTYPELNCHSVDDLRILDSRPKTSYAVNSECIETYESTIIPFWTGRSLRDRMFELLPREWHDAYEAGVFTEFMEQRAPGHTVLDDKIYAKGMSDFKAEIRDSLAAIDCAHDPHALDKIEQLKAMDIVCNAVIIFAERHAALASQRAGSETNEQRRTELERIASMCRHVPTNAPRDF
jgi:formate C-acetyltransferase